ncbi:hypothetical protein UPYG_G00200000 [Umbra pygmaea]|uniref:MIF4G domain-containing protein n=1 Tax=Umbra pygmaea TaxID=75934 RepID=A0ABD0WJM5_UMBPY
MLRINILVTGLDLKMEKCNPENQSSAPSFIGQAVQKQDMDKFHDPDPLKTEELYAQMDDILDRLTRTNFKKLMNEVTNLTINTEARLKGIVDIIYKKAIGHPAISELYAHMCRLLMGLNVPTTANPGVTVNFRKLFLNRVHAGFETIWRENQDILWEKQKEMDSITKEEECKKWQEEMEEAKELGRMHSVGIINLMCDFYNFKIITKAIMHDCIKKLLNKQDDVSLECLCTLLSTIGSNLDRPSMYRYYDQIGNIIKNRRVSPRIRGRLQSVLDLQKQPLRLRKL